MTSEFLTTAIKQFEYYKLLGEKTFNQLTEEQLFWMPNENSNSIAIVVKHLHGNMISRWTNFLTSDGEKETRDRDGEFENNLNSKTELLEKWQQGWACLFTTLSSLNEEDLSKTIYIRNQGCTAEGAIMRQLAHYPYHIGQIVYLGKMIVNEDWKSLSIPKNASKSFKRKSFPSQNTRHILQMKFSKKEGLSP